MTATSSIFQRIRQVFALRQGQPPALVVRAPGRVNLIGEHTDYSDGFVLPMAIDRAVWIGLTPRSDRKVRVYSLDFDQQGELDLDAVAAGAQARARPAHGWLAYVEGVAWALQEAGHALRGWDGVIGGDVPMGAGLSSSAALEVAVARAFLALSGDFWQPAAMAQIAQRAEQAWVGVSCGIMDQMISASGRAAHALLIDCRSLATALVPMPAGAAVVVLDTGKRRELTTSAYNQRRAECEAAARALGVPALRDATLEALDAHDPHDLPAVPRRRARHVISENLRVQAAVRAMRASDAPTLGQLMRASHASLRDDFEVSCRELDIMVDIASAQDGCHGARLTGAGFGGCAVALVARERVSAFTAAVLEAYAAATDRTPAAHVLTAAAGADIVIEQPA